MNKVFFFEKEIFEKRKEEDRYVFGNFLVAERAHNLLRIEGLYEVMWKVLGITEEEMCVKISLAFCRTFGAEACYLCSKKDTCSRLISACHHEQNRTH